eukprot:4836242-Amphidinium_carterae.1
MGTISKRCPPCRCPRRGSLCWPEQQRGTLTLHPVQGSSLATYDLAWTDHKIPQEKQRTLSSETTSTCHVAWVHGTMSDYWFKASWIVLPLIQACGLFSVVDPCPRLRESWTLQVLFSAGS